MTLIDSISERGKPFSYYLLCVCLSYGNFCGIRRESHAFDHVALPAILGIQTKLISMNEREKKTHTYPDRPTRFVLRKGVDHFPGPGLEGRLQRFLG